MKSLNPEVIIYDFDGVIVDSEKAVFKFYDIICDEFNLKKFDRSNKHLVSKILMITTEDALKLISNNDSLLKKIKQFINSRKFTELSDYISLQPNIEIILKKLKSKNLYTAIFTNRGDSVYHLLKFFNITIYFDYLVTCKDVTTPKPSPEGLLKILKHFNKTNEQALYIGDSIIDKMAAEDIEIPFIFYNYKCDGNIEIKDHLELFNYIQ
jgi:phosphoglycolate phosphatase-like HAD superfamily hydrolase